MGCKRTQSIEKTLSSRAQRGTFILCRHQRHRLRERHRRVVEEEVDGFFLPAGLAERQRVLRGEAVLDDQAREEEAAGVAAFIYYQF